MCQLCIENALSSWERYDAALPGEVPVETGKPVWNTSQVINQLDSGTHWSGNIISYSFPTNVSFFPYAEANGFSPFNAVQQSVATIAIGLWDDLIAPNFFETSNANNSDIKFSNTTTSIGYAHAYFPGGWSGAGSIWLNPGYTSLSDPDVGEYGFMTILHEIGHALGLDHAGNYNGGNPTYENDASHAQDTHMFTIMSYFSAENTGADWRTSDGNYYYAQTPMVHDILAIQSAYGADLTTRTGDTVYGFNATTATWVFDFNANPHPVLTIWDANGNDTLDLSGFSDGSVIYLEPGSYSDADGAVNNLAIAYGTWIENAVGGAGEDVITGNELGNVLRGKSGDDSISGGNGSDTLSGGSGSDQLSGGAGDDIYTIDSSADVIFESPDEGLDKVLSSVLFTTLADNLENLTYVGTGSATLTGNALGNIVTGQNNTDTITGLGGDDTLNGRNGNDSIAGGTGNDVVRGQGDADMLDGGAGDDTLRGGDGDDDLSGGDDNDTIRGDSGDDTLSGGAGNDRLLGDAGNDILSGDVGTDVLIGGAGADRFDFNDVTDSRVGALRDRVTDFDQGADVIDLGDIDAVTGGDDDTFSFIGGAAFSGTAGELRTTTQSSTTRIFADMDGDAVVDFEVLLTDAMTLTASDFFL